MTVKELKDILNTYEDNAPIYVLAMDGTHLTRNIQVGGDYSVFITDIEDDYTIMAGQTARSIFLFNFFRTYHVRKSLDFSLFIKYNKIKKRGGKK